MKDRSWGGYHIIYIYIYYYILMIQNHTVQFGMVTPPWSNQKDWESGNMQPTYHWNAAPHRSRCWTLQNFASWRWRRCFEKTSTTARIHRCWMQNVFLQVLTCLKLNWFHLLKQQQQQQQQQRENINNKQNNIRRTQNVTTTTRKNMNSKTS